MSTLQLNMHGWPYQLTRAHGAQAARLFNGSVDLWAKIQASKPQLNSPVSLS